MKTATDVTIIMNLKRNSIYCFATSAAVFDDVNCW
jgi:hypothetical protein